MVAQLGWVDAEKLRAELRALDSAPGRGDFLGHILALRLLDEALAAKARRYVELYERIRKEALYFALVERASILSKAELASWRDRLDKEHHTQSLGEHLLAAKKISAA